jgi:uncharacterized protein DUF4070
LGHGALRFTRGCADTDRFGINVIPRRLSREELRDGFIDAMEKTYTADAYFARLDGLFIEAGFDVVLYRLPYWRHHRIAGAPPDQGRDRRASLAHRRSGIRRKPFDGGRACLGAPTRVRRCGAGSNAKAAPANPPPTAMKGGSCIGRN